MIPFLVPVKILVTVGMVLGLALVAERVSPRVAGVLSGLLGIGSGAFKVVAMDQIMRIPFTVTIYWVGPMEPMLSGGNGPPDEVLVYPLKERPTVWG